MEEAAADKVYGYVVTTPIQSGTEITSAQVRGIEMIYLQILLLYIVHKLKMLKEIQLQILLDQISL